MFNFKKKKSFVALNIVFHDLQIYNENGVYNSQKG
jgi:hypothetical protein